MKRNGAFVLAAALAASGLSACGGTAAPAAPPASTVTTVSTQQVSGSPIAHVIVVVMENRTPDNLFCTAGTLLSPGGTAVGPFPGMQLSCPLATNAAAWTSLASPADPNHSYPELVAEWDGGKLDGFAADPVTVFGSTSPAKPIPGFTNTYVPPNETPVYALLAATYSSAAYMFSSALVPTFPGHQYLFAGQSGASDDPTSSVWGCDAPAGSLVSTFGTGNAAGPSVFPCFDYQSIADLMIAKNVTWAYYTGEPLTTDGNTDAVSAIKHLRNGAAFANVISPPDAVDSALQNCRLPSVSFVTPPAFASDHSGTLSAGGPGFVGDIYINLLQTKLQAQTQCQYLNNTAMILTWDDSGGWYDHVAPPTDPMTGRPFGFRVPLVVISPYANHPASAPVFVSQNNYFTFGSILRYIEDNFGLGSLGLQDAESIDLNTGNPATSLFNYAQTPIKPISGLLLQTVQRSIQGAKATNRTPVGTPVDSDR